MNIYGERFAQVRTFIGYCKDLNVETSEGELEYYAKSGVMLPVARIEYPDEYIVQLYQHEKDGDWYWDGFDGWPALGRLAERLGPFPYGYNGLSDDQLIHCFDRELEAGNNSHVIRPSDAEFRPWAEYRVAISDRQGNQLRKPSAEHYYCYWQVYQLHSIQQYPDMFRNAWLIARLPENDRIKFNLSHARNQQRLAEFDGMRRLFDALSYWVFVSNREHNRTFAAVPERNGGWTLDEDQAEAFRDRLTGLSNRVAMKFQLIRKELYGFLSQLIALHERYEQHERYRLAEALKRDVFAWEDFLKFITGQTREEVGDEVGAANPAQKRTFLHMLITTKERDYALDVLNRKSAQCSHAMQQYAESDWSFTELDARGLLDYCERQGLGLLLTSLSGMVAVGDDESRRNFRRVQMYTNLKNVLTTFEYLLKSLVEKNNVDIGRAKTLVPLIEKVMSEEGWAAKYTEYRKNAFTSAANTGELLNKLDTLLADEQLRDSVEGFWARTFLVASLARNGTVHLFPTEDRYYGDLFGPMLDAVINAMFYTWTLANRRGWA